MPPQRHIPQPTQFKVRQRSQRACAPCRKRKIKCDGTEPCAACAGYGYDCVYTEPPPRRPRPSNDASSPSKTVHCHESVGTGELVTVVAEPACAVREGIEPGKDGPFMVTESIGPDSSGDIHPSTKTRFTSAYSAIAWPKRLGLSLGMANPPRLHSFGWNVGTRREFTPGLQTNIRNIISLDEFKRLAAVYFKEVHPHFGILEEEMFYARCESFWLSSTQGADFEACICGVAALGSYFSGSKAFPPAPPCAVEDQIVEQGRVLLDLSFAHPPAMISVKHVVAWILRALYLRLTTRPHVAWMASCTAVHIAECIGLHREIHEFQLKTDVPRKITEIETESRRRTFWVALAVNQYAASEYGRTKVHIDLIGALPITPKKDDFTAQTIAIFQSAPGQDLLGRPSELLDMMKKTTSLSAKSPLLGIFRADTCFCIYRMLCSTNSRLPADQVTSFLDIIRIALDGINFLKTMEQSWWNLVSTPFHTVCVLLSIGTPESLAMVSSALNTLKGITEVYDSHLSREALRTAHLLVQGARDKRSREMDSLDRSLNTVGETPPSPSTNFTSPDVNEFQWPMDNDLGFTDFMDLSNYYNLTNEPFGQPLGTYPL